MVNFDIPPSNLPVKGASIIRYEAHLKDGSVIYTKFYVFINTYFYGISRSSFEKSKIATKLFDQFVGAFRFLNAN